MIHIVFIIWLQWNFNIEWFCGIYHAYWHIIIWSIPIAHHLITDKITNVCLSISYRGPYILQWYFVYTLEILIQIDLFTAGSVTRFRRPFEWRHPPPNGARCVSSWCVMCTTGDLVPLYKGTAFKILNNACCDRRAVIWTWASTNKYHPQLSKTSLVEGLGKHWLETIVISVSIHN